MNHTMRLNEFNVPGYGLKVGGAMDIRAKDVSGETSSTDEVDAGTKGKSLTVSLSILFRDIADLRRLIRVSEARDEGARRIYTIANETANAAGIRQVRFAERISFTEKDGLRAWDVSFTLREYLSNPERREMREDTPEAVQQTSGGTETEQGPAQTAQAATETLTGLAKVIRQLDEVLR